jgi:hypothetical protein
LKQKNAYCLRGKILNEDERGITKASMTALQQMSRIGTVAVSIVAWFAISNHCALGALERLQPLETHAACHGSDPAPTKQPAKHDSPCCKLLRATLVQPSPSATQPDFTGLLSAWPVAIVFLSEQFRKQESFELDTGPPFNESFAETVLQRSILAHAPPGLA